MVQGTRLASPPRPIQNINLLPLWFGKDNVNTTIRSFECRIIIKFGLSGIRKMMGQLGTFGCVRRIAATSLENGTVRSSQSFGKKSILGFCPDVDAPMRQIQVRPVERLEFAPP